MIDALLTIFWGLVLLTVIVFIHELGHFGAARLFGLRVKEFMIGLPGPKLSFKRGQTRYGVTAIPLGGYCLIAGSERTDDRALMRKTLTFICYYGKISFEEAEIAGESLGFDLVGGLDSLVDWGTVRRFRRGGLVQYALCEATIDGVFYQEGQSREIVDQQSFLDAEQKLTYTALPWWKRMVVLLAGSAANLIVALVVLVSILMISGTQVASTTIANVAEDSPAAQAGLLAGDTIVSLDGSQLESWQELLIAVQTHSAGDKVALGYLRNGEEQAATLTLVEREGRPIMGVTSQFVRQDIDVLTALDASVTMVGMVLGAIVQLFNPATFADTVGQTSSVVGISMEARNAAESGPLVFVLLTAALSVSIGLMNLLPIPPFDGGKIVIETIERIVRRRLPVTLVNGLSLAGLAAMILLFVVATNADINRYFLGG